MVLDGFGWMGFEVTFLCRAIRNYRMNCSAAKLKSFAARQEDAQLC